MLFLILQWPWFDSLQMQMQMHADKANHIADNTVHSETFFIQC
jgi:hypothetical protein